jgi:hypothetical protein
MNHEGHEGSTMSDNRAMSVAMPAGESRRKDPDRIDVDTRGLSIAIYQPASAACGRPPVGRATLIAASETGTFSWIHGETLFFMSSW